LSEGGVCGAAAGGSLVAGGVTIAVSVDGAGGADSGFASVAGTEAGAVAVAGGMAAGGSLAAGATAAVVAGAGAFGETDASGCTSFGGSTDVGIVPVVAGLEDEYVVVVPPEVSCVVDSAFATGTLPAQQTPNKLTPRRRNAYCLIIPRLAPIGERRGDASVADTT
jgi:hypothetical protein